MCSKKFATQKKEREFMSTGQTKQSEYKDTKDRKSLQLNHEVLKVFDNDVQEEHFLRGNISTSTSRDESFEPGGLDLSSS